MYISSKNEILSNIKNFNGITILTGENGCGKTTIMKDLHNKIVSNYVDLTRNCNHFYNGNDPNLNYMNIIQDYETYILENNIDISNEQIFTNSFEDTVLFILNRIFTNRTITKYRLYNPEYNDLLLNSVISLVVQVLASTLTKCPIFIELPESYLSSKSAYMMGRFLAEAATTNLNLIIDTHNENLLNGIRIYLAEVNKTDFGQIFYITDQYTKITIDSTGELSKWPTGFFDQTENELLQIVNNKRKNIKKS